MSTGSARTTRLVQLALLSAILFIMGFTPLGSFPLPGSPIVATLAQIPVVIGALLLGTRSGAFLGGVFGFVSLLWFTIYGGSPVIPTAFVFSPFYSVNLAQGNLLLAAWYAVCSLLICFGPRILIGVVSGKVYQKLMAKTHSVSKSAMVAGVCGSLTNTILVLLGILLFFATPYAEANGSQVIWGLLGASILFNGIPEAIVTPLITAAVVTPLSKLQRRAG
ncbi:ECF transporter S component [Clostridiaceae bacterium NSJ-31]|uniref:ECF transporter S component n=1 Tax=Ligaoa zhengdingensis TaxID=2763658 RepID=A0A926I4E6_9FIRM|nr:ECF transporter S component [Ligaoa zhengdingensis]MBC8546156.1 ECF transporter S component [Ligaoa zhengdingensis]